MVSVFWPQYDEHGWGLRKPGGGGGSWAGLADAGVAPAEVRPVVATYWLTPTVPETIPASDAGIDSAPLARRTLWPLTS